MTLFHLYLDATKFEQSLESLLKVVDLDDSIVLLGASIIYINKAINDLNTLVGNSHLASTNADSTNAGIMHKKNVINSLRWYVLETDLTLLDDKVQEAMQQSIESHNNSQTNLVTIISDESWLSLTLANKKVVSLY